MANLAGLSVSPPASASTPWPPRRAPGPRVTDDEVAGTFTVSDGFDAWRRDSSPAAVVQVETMSNLAVGAVAWGPASLGAAVPSDEVPAGAKVAVVARAIGASHPAHDVVAALRSAGHPVVLVECGWPRGGADVETRGGSPAVARALLGLLGLGREQ